MWTLICLGDMDVQELWVGDDYEDLKQVIIEAQEKQVRYWENRPRMEASEPNIHFTREQTFALLDLLERVKDYQEGVHMIYHPPDPYWEPFCLIIGGSGLTYPEWKEDNE